MKKIWEKIKGHVILAGIVIASVFVFVILIVNKNLGEKLLTVLTDKAKEVQNDISDEKHKLKESTLREEQIKRDEAKAREKVLHENREAYEEDTQANIDYINSRGRE